MSWTKFSFKLVMDEDPVGGSHDTSIYLIESKATVAKQKTYDGRAMRDSNGIKI